MATWGLTMVEGGASFLARSRSLSVVGNLTQLNAWLGNVSYQVSLLGDVVD